MDASVDVRETLRAAYEYVALGLSVLPIRGDGTKRPAVCWKSLQSRPPTHSEIGEWFGCGWTQVGLAIVTGAVSGELETIDCDSKTAAADLEVAAKATVPLVFARLVVVESPRGRHYYFRSPQASRSAKLAREPDPSKGGKRPRTLIDLKGEGGYVIAPPTPGRCHPSGLPYTFHGGLRFDAIPTLTQSERDALIAAAESVNTWVPPPSPLKIRPARPTTDAVAGRPGDDFDARADWAEILKPHGWVYVSSSGQTEYWLRPGKTEMGHSATINHDGSDRLFVFSSNAPPFEEGRSYTKFAAYAILEFGGDFSRATRALANRGYGQPRHHLTRPMHADNPYMAVRKPTSTDRDSK